MARSPAKKPVSHDDPLGFLAGGGEAARMIRERDWTGHPLGPPQGWPAEMRAALSLILNSPESMILAWGPDLHFFFNETYFPLLGPRLPWAMGERFDVVWADGWDQAQPIIAEAFAGRARHFEDLPWKLDTDRGAADTWWSFSYSRVLDGAGQVAGLFIFTNETTKRVLSDAALRASEGRFRALVTAGAQTVYRMSPDWQVMRRLDGAGFLDDTTSPSVRWLDVYIDPSDRPLVLDAIAGAIVRKDVFELEHRVRRPDGSFGWTLSRAVPVLDEKDRIVEWFGAATDVTDRHAAREALQNSEAHWRGLFELLSEGFQVSEAVRDGAGRIVDWRYLDVNPAWGELLGVAPQSVIGRTLLEAFPGIEPEWITDFARVIETGQAVTFGRQAAIFGRHFEGRAFRLSDERVGVLFMDVTERVRAEERRTALLRLGDRLSDLTAAEDMATAASEILGTTLGVMLVGYGDVDALRETIRVERDWTAGGAQTLAGTLRFRDFGSYIEDLKRGETVVVVDARVDPRTRRFAAALEERSARAFVNAPVFEHGAFVALLYVSTADARRWSAEELAFIREVATRLRAATARLRAEEGQRLLNQEMSHRLKNTLSMVLSIAGQTLRSVPDRAPVEAFEERVYALSSAHEVLLRQNWAAAPAKDVVEAVLSGAGHGDRIDVSGPDFDLGPRAVLSVSLLLHELATNAAKYGALSAPGGRVAVDWRLGGEAGEDVTLAWTERGGPQPSDTAGSGRKGFGSRLIRMGLVGTGGVDLHYPPSGLQATMKATLAQLRQA